MPIKLKTPSNGSVSLVPEDTASEVTVNVPAGNADIVTETAGDKAFKQSNILDTVSESSGVPTGGIIERGSNANGEFVKFADGTMICTVIFSAGDVTAEGSGTFADPYATVPVDRGFPSIFDAVPSVSASVGISGSTPDRQRGVVTYSVVRVNDVRNIRAVRLSSNGSSNTVTVKIIAVGRWF